MKKVFKKYRNHIIVSHWNFIEIGGIRQGFICYWDQRGVGMSFSKSMDPATMNTAQMVEDTRQMTEYQQHRFNQEKIYLINKTSKQH